MQPHCLSVLTLLVAVTAPARSADPYFTEYVEGSGSNKALEIRNGTGADVDLSTCQVAMYFNGSVTPGLAINLAGTLADGDVFVLANSAAGADILAVADQTASGSWFNGDDAVVLLESGVPVDVIGQIGFDPGSQWGTGDASTQDNTLQRSTAVTAGNPVGSDAFDPAVEWLGQPIDTFSGLGLYPDPGTGPMPLTIAEIQGAGHMSPVAGELVETTGLVTAVDDDGFYLQDAVGDGDPQTSDGLFVFTSSAPTAVVGQALRVTGTVSEFQPGGASTGNLTITEIGGPALVVLGTGNPLPAPVVLGAAGSLPPTELIDDDALAVFDPASDGLDFYEAFEGMRVRIDEPMAVSPRNGFDEIVTVTDGGAFATRLNARSGITVAPTDFNPERIQVQLDGDLLPGFAPAVTTGDALSDVVGVVSYSFGNFEVKATEPFRVKAARLSPETAPAAPADDVLSVASYNVLNLDPKVESPALVADPDSIDDDAGSGRFDRIAAHIVDNLRSPDIIALQEIQDSDGAELTAETDASLTYATLVDAIVAAGGPAYEFRDIAPEDDSSGGQPGGNIRVGFLFNPARVVLDEASLQSLVDPFVGDGDAFLYSRLPLVATFGFHGRQVTLVNNHFSSKGGSTPLFGLVQPPVNGSVDQRIAQAEVVHDDVEGLLARDPGAQVIVLGDFNEFSFYEPLAVLAGQPAILTDLSDTLDDLERYSYMFDGNSQDLDHILVTDALASFADYDPVHVNVEFEDPASDHDPLLSRMSFPAVCQPDLGFGGPGSATLAVCGDPLAPTGTATLALDDLPAGALVLLFFGLSSSPMATHGGMLVPHPVLGLVGLVDDDLDGELSFAVSGSLVAVPVSVFLQAVYPDANIQPCGFGFTNSVEVQFLGE